MNDKAYTGWVRAKSSCMMREFKVYIARRDQGKSDRVKGQRLQQAMQMAARADEPSWENGLAVRATCGPRKSPGSRWSQTRWRTTGRSQVGSGPHPACGHGSTDCWADHCSAGVCVMSRKAR